MGRTAERRAPRVSGPLRLLDFDPGVIATPWADMAWGAFGEYRLTMLVYCGHCGVVTLANGGDVSPVDSQEVWVGRECDRCQLPAGGISEPDTHMCPKCGCPDIVETHPVDIRGNLGSPRCQCLDCGQQWEVANDPEIPW